MSGTAGTFQHWCGKTPKKEGASVNNQPYLEKVWNHSDWQAPPRCPPTPPPLQWNSSHTAELKEGRLWEERKTWEKPQPICFWSGNCTVQLSLTLFLHLKETHVAPTRPSMKFNSHPPNRVFFIKAFTITVSRRAWPAQLGSSQLYEYAPVRAGRRRRV